MATSSDYLRLATSASRALADVALDGLPVAVLVADFRHKQIPVVLANSAALRCLRAVGDTSALIEVPLAQLLGSDSLGVVEQAVAALRHPRGRRSKGALGRSLRWKLAGGERAIATELKLLPTSPVSPHAAQSSATPSHAGQPHAAHANAPQANVASHPMIMLTFEPAGSTVSAALDRLPFDLLILDMDLNVAYANAAAMRRGAASPVGVLGCSVLSFMPTAALRSDVYAQALRGQSFRDDAVAYTDLNGSTRWFEISVLPLTDDAGVVGLAVLCAESTERLMRSRADGALQRRLLALTEHASDIITVADVQGRLQYVSGGVRNSLGYTSEERQSNSVFEHMHPADYPEVRAQYERLVAGKIDHFSKELRVRHKDGTYRWLESSYVSALDNPLIGGVVINARDITERKEAEFKLAQREEVLRLAADAIDGVVFEWDIVRGIVHRSRGVKEVLGLDPEELDATAEAWHARVHPLDFDQAKRAVCIALLQGRGWTVSYRIRDARGNFKSILERGLIQRNTAGDPVRAIGTCFDISEIKRLTYILAESQRTAKIGGWEYNFATREVAWTDELYRIFDANPAEPPPRLAALKARCAPESIGRLQKAIEHAFTGSGTLDVEIQISTFKGSRLWVRVIGHMEHLDGRPSRAYGSVQDIQAQKLSQIALENSTGWLKLSMNMANLHAWRWEKYKDTIDFTTLEGRLVRLPNVYPGMAEMLAKIHPKDQAAVRRAIDRAFEEHVEVREEFELEVADGRYRAYATTARPLFDATGAAFGMVGVIQDITLRRESERRLRQSEELLRTTTANTADTLFLLDTSLRVCFINRSVFARPIEQIIGREVDVLIPEPARARVLGKLRRILSTGEPLTWEFESSEAGQRRYFESHAVPVQEDGIGAGISISMRDITERKRLEQEILDVSGRERQSIGRDLHDGLGQELTGVALMLRGLATRIQTRCPDVVDNVNEIVSLVNQSIETARSLASGLLPVRRETGGIVFALRGLAQRSRDLCGIAVNFRSDAAPEFELDEQEASHLYRIAQEALTNTARHGHARRVDMVLKTNGQSFKLRIADDGRGFTLPATSTGMGLKIMKYRAGMIGAKFKVGPNEPRGTVITVASERAVTPREHAGQNTQGDFTDGNQQRMGSSSGGRAFRVEHR